jgi:hypothetical protein
MCSFIDTWKTKQNLGFDNHVFAFYLYPLIGIEISKYCFPYHMRMVAKKNQEIE